MFSRWLKSLPMFEILANIITNLLYAQIYMVTNVL